MERSNFVDKTEERFFVIWKALKAGENDTAMALLEEVDVKAVVDSSKKTLLHLSAFYGNVSITNHLVKCGCIIDAEDDCETTPLMLAIYYRHLEVIQILIDAGADLCRVNSSGRSPAFYARLENDSKIIKIIKSSINDKKAVKWKVMQRFLDFTHYFKVETSGAMDLLFREKVMYIFRFLNCYYYDDGRYSSKEVPLIKAVFLRDVHQLQMNLNYQVSPNIQDGNGWTALHAVATMPSEYFVKSSGSDAYYKLSKIRRILLDYGADLNTKDHSGASPLHVAVAFGRVGASNWLLRQGADLHAKDIKGATPLHVAAAFGYADFSKWLLKQGADVNARDYEGRTPLHAAFAHRSQFIAKKTILLFLNNGAEIFAISSKGQTVLELTKKLCNVQSIRNFILECLAVSRCMGIPVDKEHLKVLRNNPEMRTYFQKCQLELQLTKEHMIMNNVTLCDMLTKSAPTLGIYVKNEEFRNIFKSLECLDEYQIFAERIRRRFDRAVNRMNMTNDAAVILGSMLPYFEPDHPALEHLLRFIPYKDLKILTDCVNDHLVA